MNKLFKNKKGDVGGTQQQSMYFITELVLGAIVLSGAVYLLVKEVNSSETVMVAEDLAMIIGVISHKSENVHYNYVVPDFVTSVMVRDNRVLVNSKKSSTTAKIHVHSKVKIQDITMINPDVIPIIFSYKDRDIRFDPEKLQGCLNQRFLPRDKSFQINLIGTQEEQRQLNLLKQNLELLDLQLINPLFNNNQQIIEISFNQNNDAIINIPNEPEFEAMNCYAEEFFKDINYFNEIKTDRNLEGKIKINIGSYQNLTELEQVDQIQRIEEYAIQIYNALIRGRLT